MIFFITLLLLTFSLDAQSINYKEPTFDPKSNVITSVYGTFEITEPLLQQALQIPAIERLKLLYQSGITRFMWDGDIDLTRYGHSVGVMLLIRRFGGSMLEQLAGLNHDASHPGFSHVADIVFDTEAYQDEHHNEILELLGVGEFLKPFNLVLDDINHKSGRFTMLEQDRPDICADRLEYSLSTALCLGLITQLECEAILSALAYNDGKWYFTDIEQAKKFARLPLNFGPKILSSAFNRLIYHWSAVAIRQAIIVGELTQEEFLTSTDVSLLEKLEKSTNSVVKRYMNYCRTCNEQHELCDPIEATHIVQQKFWGIDPLVRTEKGYERLTTLDESFHHEYDETKSLCKKGCPVKIHDYLSLTQTRFLH